MKSIVFSSVFACAAAMAQAGQPQDAMVDYINEQVRELFQDTALQSRLADSNEEQAGFSQARLIELDQQWRSEIGAASQPTIRAISESDASQKLRDMVAESDGMIGEIILMNNLGMNAAVSAVTSDFWQGDEAKYLETFPNGPDALHVGDIEFDESSQSYQAQVSFVVTDSNGLPVGAVTVGLNAEAF